MSFNITDLFYEWEIIESLCREDKCNLVTLVENIYKMADDYWYLDAISDSIVELDINEDAETLKEIEKIFLRYAQDSECPKSILKFMTITIKTHWERYYDDEWSEEALNEIGYSKKLDEDILNYFREITRMQMEEYGDFYFSIVEGILNNPNLPEGYLEELIGQLEVIVLEGDYLFELFRSISTNPKLLAKEMMSMLKAFENRQNEGEDWHNDWFNKDFYERKTDDEIQYGASGDYDLLNIFVNFVNHPNCTEEIRAQLKQIKNRQLEELLAKK